MVDMPIYGKYHLNDFFHVKSDWADLADILQEAYGAPPYIKWLKSFQSDHKPTLNGWGKFGNMT